MKIIQITLAVLAVSLFSSVSAQESYNKWSVGLNVGGHYGANPSTIGDPAADIAHYGLNGRYMMNNRGGVMVDAGLDMFKVNNGTIDIKSNYVRTSFQMVGNIGDILNFQSWTKHIGLMTHAGFGVSVLTNSSDTRTALGVAKRQDVMMNAIVGVTPQVKLGERVSLNLDVSYITNVRQNWDYSMTYEANPRAFENYMVNWSLGATFYLGRNDRHADWTPTIYNSNNSAKVTEYERRIAELEQKIAADSKK